MMSSVLFGYSLLAISAGRVFERDPLASRIVNGEDAKVGELPYQVSLQISEIDYHFCGGSILNEYYVITAAHCVIDRFKQNLKVIAGTLKLSKPKSIHEVKNMTVHERYNPDDSWKNDIALIKVKTPFVLSDEIKMIPLSKANEIISAEQKAVVSGWGTNKIHSLDHLQRVDVIIADQEFCTHAYEPESLLIHDSQICAYDPDVEKGACYGDSGGPLTVDGKLVGITSWSYKCAQTDHPTVFTKVSKFLDWIGANAI